MPVCDVLTLRSSIAGKLRVDREAGVIYNVPVITAGVTKPSGGGHGSFDVDSISLSQVAGAINSAERIRSRITHPEVEGVDGIDRRVGYFANARVEGSKVFADFHFGGYATESERVKLCGLAEEEPEDIGVSIVSESASVVAQSNTTTGTVLRLTQLDAIDWTDDPAANPAGMLSASPRPSRISLNRESVMLNQDQIDHLKGLGMAEDAKAEDIAAFVEGLEPEQKAALEALATAPEAQPVEATEDQGAEQEEEQAPAPAAASAASQASPIAASAELGDAVRVALQADRDRAREIRAISLKCGYGDTWATNHIDHGTEIEEVRRVALANLKQSPKDMPTSTTRVTVGSDLNRDTLTGAVQDAILLRAGVKRFVEHDEEGGVSLSAGSQPVERQPHERANDFRGHSVIEMGRRYLIALGHRDADRMSRPQLAALLMSRNSLAAALPGVYLAHSTGDFPKLLADTMGKSLRREYALAPDTWSQWCGRTTAPDFKDIKPVQLSEVGDMTETPEGDGVTYGKLTESEEVYALSTYTNGLVFTRRMFINDDLKAFDSVPRKLGRAAMRNVEKIAIAILTSNAALADTNPLFDASHSNLATGTLSVTSLGAARTLMRRQTALGSDDPLETMPAFLLVPETISTLAEQLVSSTVDPAKSNATPNPFSNSLQVIPSARLDLNSTAQWYLAASPADIDTVEVAFLEGAETPEVLEEDEFDTDNRKIKIRHEVAAKAVDYRGLVRSSGA